MARQFDYDTSDYLYDTSASGIVAAHPITVAFWFYCDELPSTHGGEYCFVHLGSSLHDKRGLYIRIENNGANADALEATLMPPLQELESVSTIDVSNQTWQHACGVFTSTTLRECYLDGGNKGTNVEQANDSYVPDETHIGAWNYNAVPRDFPEAKMAELGIWNAALTGAEVATLAKGYSPLFVRPQNLVQYLPFIRDDIDRMGTVNLSTGGSPGFGTHPPIINPAPPLMSFPSAAVGPTAKVVAGSLAISGALARKVNFKRAVAGVL